MGDFKGTKYQTMTQKAAIALALLKGEVLSIMNGFQQFSCTNLPREISRSIEQEFGVKVSRTKVDHVSKWGQPGYYFKYRLNTTEYNKPGIKKMKEYLKEHLPKPSEAKTTKDLKTFSQSELFLNTI